MATGTGPERLYEAKAKKAEAATTRHLHGASIGKITGPFDVNKMTLPFPILTCFCVHDNTQNPCRCTDVVLWLPTFPVSVSTTGQKNADGLEIYDFVLPRDADVLVELQMPIKLSAMERVVTRARRRKSARVVVARDEAKRNGEGGGGAAIAKKEPPDLGWLSLAAGVGWAIGTVLDDLAGSNEGGNDNLSDDISDWAADNFPAPDWLKDIF